MFVGAEVVNPELQTPVRLRTPWFFGGGFAVEGKDVGIKASPARTALA